jgi:hypothetical protein
MQWHRRENLLKYTKRKKRPTKMPPPGKGVVTRPLTEEEWNGRKRRA